MQYRFPPRPMNDLEKRLYPHDQTFECGNSRLVMKAGMIWSEWIEPRLTSKDRQSPSSGRRTSFQP